MLKYLILLAFPLLSAFSCEAQMTQSEEIDTLTIPQNQEKIDSNFQLKVGAELAENYLSLLKGKRIAVVANQTSTLGDVHLVDFLVSHNLKINKVFSPEHGFRGTADAGEKIDNGIDEKTGLPIISLYGNNKKPTHQQLEGVDVVVFDIQDVGARFYTYISTLHYVMEACAETKIKVLVLDRPNPNGHIVDGPVREKAFKSFVGMHPIPVLHGMTIGEYAKMINGEGWLSAEDTCLLTVVSCQNYQRNIPYSLPVWPSPNLRSDAAIALYPSLCLFEGTVISIGRGTGTPFMVYGHPSFKEKSYFFTPKPSYGASDPKLNGKLCYGENLENIGIERLDKLRIDWLITAYQEYDGKDFFITKNRWFDLLAGTSLLREQIINNISEEKIRASWEPALNEFKKMRNKYLLYN
ncbi:MAG: exo-beta-N-acetylmuramidase NamZ family protein [Lishizhenia sp.]